VAKYNKALVVLLVIIVAGIFDLAGVEGLEVGHYITLLLISLGVWAVPNKQKKDV